ncbi:sulfotransferase family protein [Actinomadura meridiana]|uniref:Sulfotransferase family protein n=1 Tax=Actinomadura meridiana TaxID=559626 RepID=A0ABP8CQ97_9ACTN
MVDVLGAGFGRTGTMSLKLALERLGFGPCYHMAELTEHPEQIPLWRGAARGTMPDWDGVFAGYRSAVDWPAAGFWDVLADFYPSAKVILTVRDPQRWYESTASTIHSIAMAHPPSEEDGGLISEIQNVARDIVWEGVFDGRFDDRDHALDIFTEHADTVRRTIAPERLLEFQVSDGWEPLCAFLGVPVPDEPFPHANDREQFGVWIEELMSRSEPAAPPDLR